MIRVLTALKIGTVILMCNFGTWYAGNICTTTQYKAHTLPNSNPLIEATIGIALDLRGFNVTLIEMENGCEGENDISFVDEATPLILCMPHNNKKIN